MIGVVQRKIKRARPSRSLARLPACLTCSPPNCASKQNATSLGRWQRRLTWDSSGRCRWATQPLCLTPLRSTDRRPRPAVHAGYTQGREVRECNGHQRSRRTKEPQVSPSAGPHQATLQKAGQSSSLPTRLPRALRALAHEAVVTEDGPHPLAELGAVAARCEHRRSRRPCHPRAISSGHERYPADSHGHFEEAVALGTRLLTWGGGGGRNCMACKGSSRVRLLNFRVPAYAAGPVPRVEAIGSPLSAASSGGSPPAARPRGRPGRSRLATGR